MKSVFTRAVLAAAFALAVAPAAFAQLNRVGPVGPLGYPTWYQDKTGLTLEFCDNQTQPELEGGWCVLLPPDLPTGAAPETRAGSPVNFADEHFYYLMNAGAAGVAVPGLPGQTVKVALVAAIEGAFGGGPVKAGDEMVFARLRIRMDPLPYSGTYTVYTPYGKRVFAEQLAGERKVGRRVERDPSARNVGTADVDAEQVGIGDAVGREIREAAGHRAETRRIRDVAAAVGGVGRGGAAAEVRGVGVGRRVGRRHRRHFRAAR